MRTDTAPAQVSLAEGSGSRAPLLEDLGDPASGRLAGDLVIQLVPAAAGGPGRLGVPRRIAPTSLIVPSGFMVRSVHHQARLTTQTPRSVALAPLTGVFRPGATVPGHW
ncbi:MAG: hypothetical protein ACRDRP_18570 [Pseudonocardiaceae bacterium]